MKAIAVTGFVPNAFPAKHLTLDQCREYGRRLKATCGDGMVAFDEGWTLERCWAHELLAENPALMPSCAAPPADRFHEPQHMTRSNIVLLQRYEWMRLAAEMHPDADVVAWLEYTILKQRGVTEAVVAAFMDDLARVPCDAITLPGCWPKGVIDDANAHWRFCGSAWISPARLLAPLCTAVKTVASLRARLTGRLSWDMNTMAYVELLDVLPVRWYPAGHDETQLSHYARHCS